VSAVDQLDTAAGMAAAVAAREVSAVELVTRALERIEHRDGEVNSCVRVLGESALEEARREPTGPLAGVPVTIKEIFDVAGEVSTWGCPAWRSRPAAVRDDLHVAALRAAGAIVVARTNVPELSCWGHTDNPVYGETRNPRALARAAGGSSGGAAASVALGVAPLALGSDAGGSIRIPASFCGVVGLKPSFSALPADAAAGVSRLNCVGPLAATVEDAALALSVLTGDPAYAAATRGSTATGAPAAPASRASFATGTPRVGVSADLGFAPVDREVRTAFEATVDALAEAGLAAEPAPPPPLSPLPFIVPMLACEVYEAFADVVDDPASGLSPQTRAVAGGNGTIGGPEYVHLATERLAFEAAWRGWFADWDLLITPTTQVPAFELGLFGPDAIDGQPIDPESDGAWYPTSFVANVIGAPAISVPSGTTKDGLPLALQVMGAPGADAAVLVFAKGIEEILTS
jgi:amidase